MDRKRQRQTDREREMKNRKERVRGGEGLKKRQQLKVFCLQNNENNQSS